MSQYFDKDFFKFLLGFVAIITFSLIIILIARTYEDNSKMQEANTIQSVSQRQQSLAGLVK